MVKKFIKHYKLVHLAGLGIIFYWIKDALADLICMLLHLQDAAYSIVSSSLTLLFSALWLCIATVSVQSRYYFSKTGRNYLKDREYYKRSLWQLTEYFKDADPHRLNTDPFPVQSWHDTHGLVFGRTGDGRLISIPADSECNIAVFGPPGSGKTSGIAIVNAMCYDGSVLAVDIKGDLYNYVSSHSSRSILRFCPDSPDALQESCRFDPFSGINEMDETDRKLYLESMATILIPDEGGSDGNYFTTRARKMFAGITHLILNENPSAGFPDVVHAILQGNVFDWVKAAIASDCAPAKELLASFYGNSEKNVSSAYDALTTALVHFSSPILDELLSNTGHCVSIDDLEAGCDVYLQIRQEHLEAYAPLFTLIIQNFSTAFTRRPDSSGGKKNRNILMLLDEFPQLTFSYQLINSNLSTLRSKSVIIMIIQQNLAQLESKFQPTGARSIIGNCNYQVILGSNDINSSKVFSEIFGDRKVLKISNNINSSSDRQGTTDGQSVTETSERVYPPEYFGDLASRKAMIIYFKGKHCECIKLNCYID